jgi:hypothetical protein
MRKMISGEAAIIWAAYLHIVLRLRISGAILQLPDILQCLARGHIFIRSFTSVCTFLTGKVFMQNSQRKLGTRNTFFNVALTSTHKSYFYKK